METITMDFSSRMQQILKLLLRQEGPIPMKALAQQMGISRRTVQRELEAVERPLKKYGLTFCSKAGSGVWLDGTEPDRQAMLALLESEDTLDITDIAERRKRLILEILKDKTVKKLYYYSRLFGVSEATVSSDLEAVEGWLSGFDIKVVRKPGLGISIDGSEGNFRQALRAFIDENMDFSMIQKLYQKAEAKALPSDGAGRAMEFIRDKSERNLYRVLDEDMMRRVIASIQRVKDKRLENLTENSYTGLVLHVTIAMNRILNQELIEEDQRLLQEMEQDEDFALAEEMARQLEAEFQVAIPQAETAYICLHIKGSKIQQYEVEGISGEMVREYRKLLDLVNEMIDRYDSEVAYMLKQDEEFVVQGLIAHLQPTLFRLSHHMTIQNPLLEHIKAEYPEVYRRCQEVAKVIEERYGYPVPDTEIGFLAVHFGAAMVRLENQRENKRKVMIGVVCASGIGISRLMVSKLSHHFMDRAEVTAYGTFELSPYVLERLDFLVATLPLQAEIEILTVGPLLTEEEMEQVERRVRYYERIPKKSESDNPFTRQLEQVNFMAMQIKTMIKEMGYLLVDPAVSFSELLAAVSKVLSPYPSLCGTIQEDLIRRENLGTQIFADVGFGLLHAKTKGVRRPSFSVCLTQDLGPFQDTYFQEIRAVIVMLLPDDDHVPENRKLLGYLSEILVEEPEFLEIIAAGQKAEIQSALSRYLEKFFHQYLDRM